MDCRYPPLDSGHDIYARFAEPRGDNVKQRASAIITDLDNTLFDWVGIWYRSFNAMLSVLVEQSGIPQEQLEEEIRRVHQRHGTSEYAFLVQELPSLRTAQAGGADPAQKYGAAIEAYRKARDESLALYPTVLKTLETIRNRGCLIIAYTESMAFYTNYRIRRLGLDGLIDLLYSPPDHDLPAGTLPKSIRRYPADAYELKRTRHRYIPAGVKKPDPRVLRQIIDEIGVTTDDIVYIGDSLMKDIAMAVHLGARSALARYGAAQNREEYELLRRVTHWTDGEVEKERHLLEGPAVRPTFYLDRSFSELLAHIELTPFERDGA